MNPPNKWKPKFAYTVREKRRGGKRWVVAGVDFARRMFYARHPQFGPAIAMPLDDLTL